MTSGASVSQPIPFLNTFVATVIHTISLITYSIVRSTHLVLSQFLSKSPQITALFGAQEKTDLVHLTQNRIDEPANRSESGTIRLQRRRPICMQKFLRSISIHALLVLLLTFSSYPKFEENSRELLFLFFLFLVGRFSTLSFSEFSV